MNIQFQKDQLTSTVVYGEPLASAVPKELLQGKHVLIITNQRYYDRFFEKISRVMDAGTDLDWYIVSNQLYCNNLTEMMDILDFFEKFPKNKEYLMVAFGNEGVIQLSGFLQKNTVLNAALWAIPVSVRALTKSMVFQQKIVRKSNAAVLQIENIPQKTIYDQIIAEGQVDGKLVDFLMFIQCGLVCDHLFLKNLYKNFSTKKQVLTRSFTALLKDLTDYYQKQGSQIQQFGALFEQAFYETENGHLLSSDMKRLLGILFHLIWSSSEQPFPFHLQNFMAWLLSLGYPIKVPQQLSLSEYSENVVKLSKSSQAPQLLTAIGRLGENTIPSESALIAMMQTYQQIINEI